MSITKPRILHISTPISWRGGEQQIAYLQAELQKQGLYQLIICPIGSEMEQYCKKENIEHLAIRKGSGLDLTFAAKLKKVCKQHSIDLMHAHDAHAHTFSVLSKVLFGNPVPIILARRVDFPVKKSWFSRFKYNHPGIKRIICVSHAIKDILSPSIKDQTKIEVVHSGIDLEKFKADKSKVLRNAFKVPEDVPIIANVGALAQQKDYFTFVDTMELLTQKGIKACFMGIGDGAQKAEILAYAKQKGLAGQLILTGFRKDLASIFNEIDILLFSSETEGLGTTILDAFAAKVAVVSTNAGGIPELVKHLETGYLGEVKNPGSLASGVELFLDNPEKCATIVAQASQFVKQFDKAQTALKTLDIYRATLD
jgi:glycosyltransferase involved in cell wall biosynthesis